MSNDQILVATDKKYAQIKVIGKGIFACSQNMRDFCIKIIETNVEKITIDLDQCTTIDSTFMGVLAMVGLRGRKKNVQVEIANVDEAKKKLLKGLGLEKLFLFTRSPSASTNWKSLCKSTDELQNSDQIDKAKIMLEAHEVLIDVDANNKSKFIDVIEFLKEDIQKLK